MNEDKDKKAPEEGEERTVFVPSGGGATAEPPAQPAGHDGHLSDPEPAPIEPETAEPPADALPGNATPADEAKTVFAPAAAAGSESAEAAGESQPAEPAPLEEPRTVFVGSGGESPAGDAGPAPAATADAVPSEPGSAEVPPAASAADAPPAKPPEPSTIAPREGAQSIKVGDVLNHIFEVKRFVGRGGMGEVFEGCNVNTDERVAIKVMLPAMAADAKIVALFRREARTLTKLQHEALVSYRVLAQEPDLGVLYIVTEYIEGVELCDVLGDIAKKPDDLVDLLRRLASGLAHAHRIGAVHRDLSPDNVILPNGNIHEATIIDFGIAKDLEAGSATIVGDGFAGKLNYVAPEQLGDFGRDIGPWTDVYSLGLVMLAAAQGKSVNMSGSLVDAIDKRRKGPDLSGVPGDIRALLRDMLEPDPQKRIRSMDDVLARIGGTPIPTLPPTPPPPDSPMPPPEGDEAADGAPPPPPRKSKLPWLIGGLIVVALLAAAGAYFAFDGLPWGKDNGNEIVPTNEVEPTGDPVADARNAINSVLPSVACTWLDISDIRSGNDGLVVAMRGVAGEGENAQRDLSQALSRAGVRNARLDFGDVAPINQAGCAALDTYRQVRATRSGHVSVAQPRFEMMMQPPGMPYAGELAANAVVNFNLADAGEDFTILGIEPSGKISTLIADRSQFESVRDQSMDGRPITDDGNGRYRLNVDLNHDGWSGIILITGRAPFVTDVVAPPVGSRGPSWQQRFLQDAADRRWRVEMVWFESVNRQQGDTATPAAISRPADEPPAEDYGGAQGPKPTE